MKKTISVLLSVIIALSCMGVGIVANASTPWIDNKETGEFCWNEKSGDWEFLQISANSACLTKYYGSAETLDVPSKINGLTVSEIGDNAFNSNKSIKKVILPNGVVKIGLGAFENCENLVSVSLGTKVRSIGLNAFYNTKIFSSKIKSKNVVYIGKYLVACDSDKYGKKFTV
ncbi:MAG: leucine-rich repeat domain-containing protein, partial [Eubacterium coprostanoligenes]|uniref:leucine-rich repeat domain-containing protein n=1 Tax=Eubacterium coprostanoligenes TaxID=290054 RepID=UPI0023F25EF6